MSSFFVRFVFFFQICHMLFIYYYYYFFFYIFFQVQQGSVLPPGLCNNHFRPEFMKLVPEILGFQCDFGVVVDFLLGFQALHAAQMSRLMVAESRVESSLRCPGQAVLREGLGKRPGRQAERREEGRLRGR